MKPEKRKRAKDTFVGRGTSTESVHAGELHGHFGDSLTEPVFLTSTYIFKNTEDIEAFTSGSNRRFEYGRYGNPTQQTAEKKLSVLEGSEACLLFDSGMSAVTATLLTFLSRGLHMIATDDSYKKTLLFCEKWLPQFGIKRTIVKMGDYRALAEAINNKTKVILVESPTNPYLNIFDFNFIKTIKKEHPNVIVVKPRVKLTPDGVEN